MPEGEASGFYEVVAGRRSIRRFTEASVPDETVWRIFAAACRAPSAHNRQPWRFVVLGRSEARRRLVERMTARWRADLEADGLPAAEVERLLQRNEERLLKPPLTILVLLTMEDMDAYPDPRRRTAERTMAIQSVAMAGGQLLLAAQAEGLGACWICGPLFVPELVRETLELPESWEAQGVIALGYPLEAGRERERRPVEEVVLWR